jgi:hypothetical protein
MGIVWTRQKQALMGLAAGLLMSYAQAEPLNNAHTVLSNFKVDLTDLAPADGIAPAITFKPAGEAFSYQDFYYDDNTVSPGPSERLQFYGYGEHTVTQPGVNLQVSTQPFALGVHLSGAMHDVTAFGGTMWQLDFSLTPHTSAVFTVDLDTAQGTDTSFTRASMEVKESEFWNAFLSEATTSETGATHRSLSGTLVSADEERMRTLNMFVFAFMAAPIPEPSTYAMLLAGLAVIGWRARRRITAIPARPRPTKPNDAGSGTLASLPKNSSSLIWCIQLPTVCVD